MQQGNMKALADAAVCTTFTLVPAKLTHEQTSTATKCTSERTDARMNAQVKKIYVDRTTQASSYH